MKDFVAYWSASTATSATQEHTPTASIAKRTSMTSSTPCHCSPTPTNASILPGAQHRKGAGPEAHEVQFCLGMSPSAVTMSVFPARFLVLSRSSKPWVMLFSSS